MLLNINHESLKNQIEFFVPRLPHVMVEDIILSPTTTQNCLENISKVSSGVAQFVINIFKSGLSGVLTIAYCALKTHMFVQIRAPLCIEAYETVRDFYSNPHNRSTFEKINALVNAVYIGMQTTETIIRAGIFKVSAAGRERIVMVTCALSFSKMGYRCLHFMECCN